MNLPPVCSRECDLIEALSSIDEILWTFRFSDRQITFVSPAVERVYGYPAARFHADPHLWFECIAPVDRPGVRAFAAGLGSGGPTSIHYRIIRSDGAVRWLRYTVHVIEADAAGPKRAHSIGRDVTEEYTLQESLRRSHRALLVIHDCKEKIMAAQSERALLQGVCEVAVRAGYVMAWAGLTRSDGQGLILEGIAGEHQNHIDSIQGLLAQDMRRLGTIERALRTRRPAKTSDFARDAHLPWRRAALRRGFRSIAALPLSQADEVLGILSVYATEQDAFDTEEMKLLEHLAQDTVRAIQSLRNRAQRIAAQEALHLRHRAIEASANAIVIASATLPHYPIEYVNPAFERMTGYAAEEIIGKSLRILHRDDCDQPGLAQIRTLLSERREGHATMRNYRKDGELFWSTVHISPVMDGAGEVSHFVAAKYDITQTKHYQDRLEAQANLDALTGLANRKLLYERLREATRASPACGDEAFWVAFLDLDRFKLINDSLGHRAGDQLLQQIATRLRHTVRDSDTLARLGGDEFVLILPTEGEGPAPEEVLHNIMQVISQAMRIDGHDFYTTCSIGVAVYPHDGTDPDTLIKHADTAMYHAKETGRNNFQRFTPALKARAFKRMRLEAELRRAIENQEFVLHYQPQVHLQTGRIHGLEALIRWRHPDRGLIAPRHFIELAEDTGLIIPIGNWVIRQACLQCKAWQAAGSPDLSVSVNLSARQLNEQGLVQSIRAVLDDITFDPRHLGMELTENIAMADVGHTIDMLCQLKQLGLQLSIDDFGTGYSSLSYLTRFPVRTLKIDQSFVRDMTTSPRNAAVISSIIDLAHKLQLEVIAEGVETRAQASFLQQIGCDLMQGYYFSKPVPADELEMMLHTRRTRAGGGLDGVRGAGIQIPSAPSAAPDSSTFQTPWPRVRSANSSAMRES
jgi:diguanylate cyclase (GGDEF)-like protein/PAS domain S-box-containing protein